MISCLLAAPLEDEVMQQLAREFGLSETAFAWPENEGYRLRWFTPAAEVRLCGHATVAAEAASADVLVVLGHPDYYPRFGFRPARASGLLTTYDVPDDVFLALPLVGDATVPRGLVRYHDAFAALD